MAAEAPLDFTKVITGFHATIDRAVECVRGGDSDGIPTTARLDFVAGIGLERTKGFWVEALQDNARRIEVRLGVKGGDEEDTFALRLLRELYEPYGAQPGRYIGAGTVKFYVPVDPAQRLEVHELADKSQED